jgi:hypothetical protein
MATGRTYAGFFPKRIIGSSVIEDDIFGAVRQSVADLGGQAIGEGVFDPNAAGLVVTDDAAAINERKLSVSGDLSAINDSGNVFSNAGSSSALVQVTEGARTYTIHDPDWYVDLPYENANGTTYYVYLHNTRFPVDVGIARDGSRGYSKWVDAPGVSVAATSVTDTGTSLRLLLDGTNELLTTYGVQKWLTANTVNNSWSYDCVVYLDTDVTGVEIGTDDPDTAIAFTAKLVKHTASNNWRVDLSGIGDGYLGQSVPSLTAAHYRIVILGPVITTTNFDSDPDFTHVATVVSSNASEAIDHSDQVVVRQLSDFLNEFDDFQDNFFQKGIITRPTVTGSGPVNIASGGYAIVNGAILPIPAASITVSEVSQTVYLYFDSANNVTSKTTSWATANGANNVPFFRYEVDGASAIVSRTYQHIGRSFYKFPNSMRVTVATDSSHNAMFTTLKQALSYFVALKEGGVDSPTREIVLVGDVTETEVIDVASMLELENVIIRAASPGNAVPADGGSPTTSVGTSGARIKWSFTGESLFKLTSGTAKAMRGWRFESVGFRFEGTTSNSTRAVVCIPSGSSFIINGLSFHGCTFDLSDTYASQGGASGRMAHVVFGGDGQIRNLSITKCVMAPYEAAVYNASANGIQGLVVTDNVVVGQGTGSGGTTNGFIVDLGTNSGATTISRDWMIARNRATLIDGPCVSVNLGVNIMVLDNYFNSDGNSTVVLIGNTTTPTACENVMISGNIITQSSGGSAALLRVATQDGSSPAGIIVSNNIIDGLTSPASGIGVQLSSTTTGTRSGWMFTGNIIKNVITGLSVVEITESVVANNVIHATTNGVDAQNIVASGSFILNANIVYGGASAISVLDADMSVISANVAKLTGVSAGAVLTLGSMETAAIVGNALVVGSSNTGGGTLFDAGSSTVWSSVSGNVGQNLGSGNVTFVIDSDKSVYSSNVLKGVKVTSTASGTGATKNAFIGMLVDDTGTVWSAGDVEGVMVGCILNGGDATLSLASGAQYTLIGSAIYAGGTGFDAIDRASGSGNTTLIGCVFDGDIDYDGTGALYSIGSFGTGFVNHGSSGGLVMIGSLFTGDVATGASTVSLTMIGSGVNDITHNGSGSAIGIGLVANNYANAAASGSSTLLASVFTGNVDNNATGGSGNLTMVGCAGDAVKMGVGPDDNVLVGNRIETVTDDSGGTGTAGLVIVGNLITSAMAISLYTDNTVVVGNRIAAAVTLAAAMSNGCVVGNRFSTSLTDSSTGSTVANNE